MNFQNIFTNTSSINVKSFKDGFLTGRAHAINEVVLLFNQNTHPLSALEHKLALKFLILNDITLSHNYSISNVYSNKPLYFIANTTNESESQMINIINEVKQEQIKISKNILINSIMVNYQIEKMKQKKENPPYGLGFLSIFSSNKNTEDYFEKGYQEGIKAGVEHGILFHFKVFTNLSVEQNKKLLDFMDINNFILSISESGIKIKKNFISVKKKAFIIDDNENSNTIGGILKTKVVDAVEYQLIELEKLELELNKNRKN